LGAVRIGLGRGTRVSRFRRLRRTLNPRSRYTRHAGVALDVYTKATIGKRAEAAEKLENGVFAA
jgi:hypothetical protein